MSQTDGSYLPYIIRYSLTEQDKQALITGSPIDFTNKGKVFLLNDYNIVTDILGKYIYEEECGMVYTWEEVRVVSQDPGQCDCYPPNYVTYAHILVGNMVCTSGGGGGGDSEIGTSPHGIGGGSQTFPDTPCGRLQKGTSNQIFKQNFKSLNKPEKFVLPFESGFAQKKTDNFLSYSYLRSANGTSLNMPLNSLNYTHVHNNHMITDSNGNTFDSGVKILSPADIRCLITTCQNASVNANINPTEAFGIMISNEGIFAITLLEPLSLAELGQLNTKWKIFNDNYYTYAGTIISDPNLDALGRKKALQKMLLNELKKAGLENKVGLFEGDAQDNIDSYDINWTKKSLNPTNSNANLIETPC